jgi:hypothetical protein
VRPHRAEKLGGRPEARAWLCPQQVTDTSGRCYAPLVLQAMPSHLLDSQITCGRANRGQPATNLPSIEVHGPYFKNWLVIIMHKIYAKRQ